MLLFALFPVITWAQDPMPINQENNSTTTPYVFNDGPVVIVRVDEDIKAGTNQFLRRAHEQARSSSASLFVVKLNTPGGLLQATEAITRLLLDSDITTVVYVNKPSGWAFSAGTFILLSADISASHPTASIGAASPVGLNGEEAGEKVVEASSVWIRSLAKQTGKNTEVAELFVRENKTLDGTQAFDQGVVDILADNLDDLLLQLGLSDRQVVEMRPNFGDMILSFLSLPYLIPLLLSLGGIGLFFVFRTGEIDSIGLLGVVFLLVGLWGLGTIQLSWLGVMLLIFGLSLVAFEFLFSPGDFGISGIVGALSLFLGVITFANEPFFPSYLTQALFWSVVGVFVSIVTIFVIIGRLSVSAQKRPIQAGMESYIGQIYEVKKDLDPKGYIVIDGESYPACTEDGRKVVAGTKVRVVKTRGNTILVNDDV